MATSSKNDIADYLQHIGYRHIALIAAAFISLGAAFYHFVEKFTWLDSFYFTFMTLATVGYGDLVPRTAAGKLFTMVYVLLGITIFIGLAKILLSGLALHQARRRNKD